MMGSMIPLDSLVVIVANSALLKLDDKMIIQESQDIFKLKKKLECCRPETNLLVQKCLTQNLAVGFFPL